MKKLVIVGILCMLSSYLYATPSWGANAYTQLQSEGSFFVTQAAFESYVPFQSDSAEKNPIYISARRTRNIGIITTSTGLALGLIGFILVGVGGAQAITSAPDTDLLISGFSMAGLGALAMLGGGITWGIGAGQMRTVISSY